METVKSDITKRHPGGRPKKVVKKETSTGVRLTKFDYLIIKQKASIAGLSLGAYIREMALKGQVLSRLNEEERMLIRQLVGMANNVNQITNMAHKQGVSIALTYFINIRQTLDKVLEKLRK